MPKQSSPAEKKARVNFKNPFTFCNAGGCVKKI